MQDNLIKVIELLQKGVTEKLYGRIIVQYREGNIVQMIEEKSHKIDKSEEQRGK